MFVVSCSNFDHEDTEGLIMSWRSKASSSVGNSAVATSSATNGSSVAVSTSSSSSSLPSFSSSSSSSISAYACTMPTDCTPAGGTQIEVLCPSAGATIKAGDSLTMIWRANISNFTGFLPQASADGGSSFINLTTASVLAPSMTPINQCLSVRVLVPAGNLLILGGVQNSSVVFRVRDYTTTYPTLRANSPAVTVIP